jgi:glycine/D-amino acid oxidase-like deaminating enzyme
MQSDVIVIGAGTVGAAIAYGLAKKKLRVELLDGDDGDFRAARANFGLVWLQGKGINMPAYQQLTGSSCELYTDFNKELGELTKTDIQYEHNGGLQFCLGEEEFENRRLHLQRLHNQLGADQQHWEMLDRKELEKLLPKVPLGPDVAGASFGRRDGCVNPLKLLTALLAGFQRLGGRLRTRAKVTSIVPGQGSFTVAFGDDQVSAPRLVIAAGLGSPALGRQVGLDFPLRPQRGQILVTERFDRFLPLPSSGFRQTSDGTIMIGATQEEVGFDTSTTSTAAQTLAKKITRIVPALANATLVRQWAGLRIMTRSPKLTPAHS